MASQSINLQIKGLVTNVSDVAGAPPGSLSIARNIDIGKLNIAQARRGFDLKYAQLPDSTYRSGYMFEYGGTLYSYFNGAIYTYNTTTQAWTSRGSVSLSTGAVVPRAALMNNNLYMATSTGLKKTDATGTSLYDAGIPTPTAAILAVYNSGSGTAIANGKTAAYRWIICRKDANENIVYGPVSSSASISASAAIDVTVTGYLPASVITSDAEVVKYFVQVYRTFTFTTPSSSTVPIATDEMQLCYEHALTTADRAATYFTFNDIAPDAMLGASLYTSPSQEGISQNNLPPPVAADIAEYKQYMFFADTRTVHRLSFALISAGGSAGLSSGDMYTPSDTIVLSDGTHSETYTAKNAGAGGEVIGSKYFLLDDASASIAVRVDTTIRSLVKVINRGSAYWTAYVDSTDNTSLPGKIRIEQKTLGDPAFTAVCSARPSAFSPNLTSAVTASNTSSNDVNRNGLMWSKVGLPEAVPLLNFMPVGTASDPIARIIALRDALLIFKEQDGIFILRGNHPNNFSLEVLDRTAKVVAKESLVGLNGLVYGAFESGIGSVSDSEFGIISQNIQDKFQTTFGQYDAELDSVAFGIGYEADNKYILALPAASGATTSTYQLVYDVFAGLWVEWDLDIKCGFVSPSSHKLVLGSGNSRYVLRELKAYDYTDFGDYNGTTYLTSSSGTTLVVPNIDDFSVGDLLDYGASYPAAYVTDLVRATSVLTVDLNRTWASVSTFADGAVSTGSDTITIASHTFETGDTATLTTAGTIGGLTTGTNYYIINASANTVKLATSLANATAGTGIDITSVSGGATHTLTPTIDHYKAIDCEIEWIPDFAGNPTGFKHYSECNFVFKAPIIQSATITFASDTTPAAQVVTVTGASSGGEWGSPEWGEFSWGGEEYPAPIRLGVPRIVARCNSLSVNFTHKVAQSTWQLEGFALTFTPSGTRTSR